VVIAMQSDERDMIKHSQTAQNGTEPTRADCRRQSHPACTVATITASSEKVSCVDKVFAECDIAIAPVVSLVPKEEGTILLSRATRSLQILVVSRHPEASRNLWIGGIGWIKRG
jgi:hypothetical protein